MWLFPHMFDILQASLVKFVKFHARLTSFDLITDIAPESH